MRGDPMMPGERTVVSRAARAGMPFRVRVPDMTTLVLPAADVLGLAAGGGMSGVLAGADGFLPWSGYTVAVLGLLAASRQHRLRICLRVSDQADRIAIAAALPLLPILGWLTVSQAIALVLWSAGLVFGCRLAACAALRAAHRRGLLTEPALVVGAGTFGAYVAELLRGHPELGLRPRGFLDDGPIRRDLALPTVGRPADLAEVVERLGIRRVIVCFSTACRDEDLVALLRAHGPLRADVCVVPRLYELGMAMPRGAFDELWGIPLIPLRRPGGSAAARAGKRLLDVGLGGALLAASAPLLLALAAVIRVRSGQHPLFRQRRVTGDGRVAEIVKLRTLTAHTDHDTRWPSPAADAFGLVLRSSHVDELPQLANVLKGEMSLVGPRPERPYFAERFSRDIPRYGGRARMPAGMTGLAQVNGLTGDTSIFERARFDNYYIEYWSIWLDLTILVRTLTTLRRTTLRRTTLHKTTLHKTTLPRRKT